MVPAALAGLHTDHPGEQDLATEDVIASVDRGIYIKGRGAYSIDQQRYNFQFGGQAFWEIRGGRLAGIEAPGCTDSP